MKVSTAIKLCWYNIGYRKAIEDYRLALQEKYESNRAMVKKVTNDRNLIVAVTNLDSGQIDTIAQKLLEKRMENAKNKEND